METISWSDFERVELRVGTIVSVDDFPEARKPAFQIRADFGPEIGIKQSSAQITALYTKDELIGRQILGVVNFPPDLPPWMEPCDGCRRSARDKNRIEEVSSSRLPKLPCNVAPTIKA